MHANEPATTETIAVENEKKKLEKKVNLICGPYACMARIK
jgi:hypothetical protein